MERETDEKKKLYQEETKEHEFKETRRGSKEEESENGRRGQGVGIKIW